MRRPSPKRQWGAATAIGTGEGLGGGVDPRAPHGQGRCLVLESWTRISRVVLLVDRGTMDHLSLLEAGGLLRGPVPVLVLLLLLMLCLQIIQTDLSPEDEEKAPKQRILTITIAATTTGWEPSFHSADLI